MTGWRVLLVEGSPAIVLVTAMCPALATIHSVVLLLDVCVFRLSGSSYVRASAVSHGVLRLPGGTASTGASLASASASASSCSSDETAFLASGARS